MNNNVIYINSSKTLLEKYMNAESMSNSNLFGINLPTDNLIEGRLFFRKISNTEAMSIEEVDK